MIRPFTKAGIGHGVIWAIRQWWRRATCEHTHTFTFSLDRARWLNRDQIDKGEHGHLSLVGCYICGHTEVRDFGA